MHIITTPLWQRGERGNLLMNIFPKNPPQSLPTGRQAPFPKGEAYCLLNEISIPQYINTSYSLQPKLEKHPQIKKKTEMPII
jgi:hypothetical protein